MNTYMLESLEDGSHGIIPSEGINYFVGKKRIVVHKDGKKVIDKEIDINPDGTISKYNLICDDDKEPELEPVKDVEEYNVANMLPQVYPEDTVLKKESDLSIEDLTNDFNVMIENCDNILNKITILKESTTVEDSEGEFITESMVDHVNGLEESATSDKVKRVAKSTLVKVEKFVSEKIDLLKDLKKESDKLKKNDIKKKLVKNQKEFRSFMKDCDPKTKKRILKHYSDINLSTIDQINLNNFMDQVRRDSEDAIRANEDAMRASQTAMDMQNQFMQQQMMNNMMF